MNAKAVGVVLAAAILLAAWFLLRTDPTAPGAFDAAPRGGPAVGRAAEDPTERAPRDDRDGTGSRPAPLKRADYAADDDAQIVVGTVVDALGDPVPGANVRFDPPETAGARVVPTCVADAVGRFEIRTTGCKSRRDVVAEAPGRPAGRVAVEFPEGESRVATRIRLLDGARVVGHVVDEDMNPIPGAAIYVSVDWPHSNSDVLALRTTTDAAGRYELPALPYGTSRFWATAAGFLAQHRDVRTGEEELVDIQMARGDAAGLEFEFVGLTDEQAARATVEVAFWLGGDSALAPQPFATARRDPDGVWRASGLPAAQYWCVARVGDDVRLRPSTALLNATSPPRRARFSAEAIAPARVEGRLTDSAGAPLPSETLRFRWDFPARTADATTDDDGRFAVAVDASSGTRFRVRLVGSSYALAQERPEPPDAARTAALLPVYEFTLKEAGPLLLVAAPQSSVSGRVVDASGAGIGDVAVELQDHDRRRNPGWSWFARTTTDRDGRFEFDGLRGFDGSLRVVSPGSGVAGSSDVLRYGPGVRHRDVVVRTSAGGLVEGRVLDAESSPVAGARLRLRAATASTDPTKFETPYLPEFDVVADREGRFRIRGVLPGEYELLTSRTTMPRSFDATKPVAEKDDRPPFERTTLTVGPGERVEREVRFQ